MSTNIKNVAAGVVIAVVVVALLALFFNHPASTGTSSTIQPKSNLLSFSLTDPPRVPVGTTSLVISYSSVQAHLAGSTNSSGWINATGTGSINLMSLINTSQIIGTATMPANASINAVRFNVADATMVVNGTTYNVTVPSSQITATVKAGRINASTSVLMDMSPVVAAIYTQNSTIFVLVPSVKAIIVPGANATAALGARSSVTPSEKAGLEAAAANISITSAQITSSNNSTTLSVTVKNNANTSVVLRHVVLFGNASIMISPLVIGAGENFPGPESGKGIVGSNASENSSIPSNAVSGSDVAVNGTAGSNAVAATAQRSISLMGNVTSFSINSTVSSKNVSVSVSGNITRANTSIGSNMVAGAGKNPFGESTSPASVIREVEHAHIFHVDNMNMTVGSNHEVDIGNLHTGIMVEDFNSTANISANESHRMGDLLNVGLQASQFRVLNFIVGSNSTLILPFSEQDMVAESKGYLLQPGASVTLTFSGPIVLGNGHIRMSLHGGYKVVVQGEDGASATTSTVAVG